MVLAPGAGLASPPQDGSWRVESNPILKRLYPWGDEDDANRANYSDTDIGATSAVGCFPGGAGPYGAEELSGNEWEWTRSLYGPYPYPLEEKDRLERENLETSQDEGRVLRGGAFFIGEYYVRCALRFWLNPYSRDLDFGFRVVASPSVSGL